MDLSGLSQKWDAAVTDLQAAVAAAQPVDSSAAISAALDAAAEQVAAQTAALRSQLAG